MELTQAIPLVKTNIETDARHVDYKHVKDLAETYKIYITGKNIDKKLVQFAQREDPALFAQRVKLTKSITPAVASSVRKPFNKVVRNDRVRKHLKFGSEGIKQKVAAMSSRFYGSARKKTKGLDYWLKTRFTELQFTDPNAWVVVEWDAPETAAQIVTPRPFEVSATQAVNFFIDNEEVKWLLVCQDIKYNTLNPGATGGTGLNTGVIAPANTSGAAVKADGKRWTLYDTDVTVVYESVDKAYLEKIGYQLGSNEALETIKDKLYLLRTYAPKVGYVPAFRVGYARDEETDGRTYVNPWHDALCFFEKTLKTVSELDLTMSLHVFPQKLQYVQKCKGRPTVGEVRGKACNNGFEQGTTNVCGECKGTGHKVHTSAQDAILLPMPDTPQDMFPLENMLVYKAPPIDLVKFQNDYVLQLEKQVHQTVFNSQVFIKKNGGGVTEQGTATQAEFNMQSVYDALEPFTEKFSEIWRELTTIFAVIAGDKVEAVEVGHDFPADYKLKTTDLLLTERKVAGESGAPPFFIETLDDDLATITFAGDDLGLLKYRVKRRFYPFTGKNEEEVALLLGSEYVPKSAKVLYSNFDLIFRELEQEEPAFFVMKDLKAQRILVETKVTDWIQKLSEEAPTMSAGLFPRFPGEDAGSENSTGDDQ